MSKKHVRTLQAIFAEPVRANIAWHDVEVLFTSLGAEVTEGAGSRVWVELNGVRAVFHEPHPEKEISKPAVRSVREFLTNAGFGSRGVMQYKSFTGVVEVDEEAGIIFGKVVGLRDVITFQGESVAEARQAFEESVDSYLEFCAARGEEPEKPYSGKFVVRIDPELHRALAMAAEAEKVSLNALAELLLRRPFSGKEPRCDEAEPETRARRTRRRLPKAKS